MNEMYIMRLFDYYKFLPLWDTFKNLTDRRDFIMWVIESRAKKNRKTRYCKNKISSNYMRYE